MATTRRGVNTYTQLAASGATAHIPLPSGSVAGDWVIYGGANSDNTKTMSSSGSTSLLAQVMGTGYVALFKKQLDSTDISNGYVSVVGSGSMDFSGVIVGYSASGGFGTLGTIYARSGSQATVVPVGVSSDGSQDVLVFRFEKSTNNSGGVTGTSPSITALASALQAGTSRPSAWVGVQTASSTSVTVTDSVSSANGIGVQIPVTQSAGGVGGLSYWDGTTEQPLASLSYWDGTTEQPLAHLSYWDGTTEQPIY